MAFRWRWLWISFALILGGGSLCAATKEQTTYAAAVAAFQNEIWSRAETLFAQFIQQYPKSTNAPTALLLEAQAEFKQGDFTNAVAKLTDPNNLGKAAALADQFFYWTGEAQFANSNFQAAAKTLVSLSEKFPESPVRLRSVVVAAAAYAHLTNWLQHDALLEDTNGVFQRVAQLDAGNELVVDGRLSLENSKYQQRDFPGVVAVYERLTNQWQTLKQVQQCEGVYLFYRAKMALGDFPAALAAATNLVQIASSPANQEWLATGWASQGSALEQMDHLPEAIQAWQNNLTNAPVAQEREAILKIAEQEIVRGQLTNAWNSLTNFLGRFPEAIAADIARLTMGELHLEDYTTQPEATNQLSAARDCFNEFLRVFTNSPLAGKAHLDRGWCWWMAGDITNSLADFQKAADQLPPSEDLAVARFKTGDAMLALTNCVGALENYQAVLDDFTNFPAVTRALGDRALYQSLRANLGLTNYDGASNTLAQILERFPASNLAPDSTLLYGESLVAATNELSARAIFQEFLEKFPGSLLRPEVEFAIARTYGLGQNWPAATAGYEDWLKEFPTNGLRPQVVYALALANYQAGNKTNAFGLFTNFVAQFPANEQLTPLAQWWLADYFFGGENYLDAEKNYELVYQHFPRNDLASSALLMAGRAAVARQDYKGAINNYFIKLEGDTNCPAPLRAQAAFAYGNALMSMDSTETNDPLANFRLAPKVFFQIGRWDPTNELVAQAGIKIGDCNFQLANYDEATNTYAQVVNSTNASASARSQAQFKIGVTLEKMAALASGTFQKELLDQALLNYLDVFDKLNLRDGEEPDPLWRKEAGLRAAPLVGRLNDLKAERNFYGGLKEALPQLSDLVDKKIAALPAETP